MEFIEAICIAGHTWIQNCANVRRYSVRTPSYHSRVWGGGGWRVSVKQWLETGRKQDAPLGQDSTESERDYLAPGCMCLAQRMKCDETIVQTHPKAIERGGCGTADIEWCWYRMNRERDWWDDAHAGGRQSRVSITRFASFHILFSVYPIYAGDAGYHVPSTSP